MDQNLRSPGGLVLNPKRCHAQFHTTPPQFWKIFAPGKGETPNLDEDYGETLLVSLGTDFNKQMWLKRMFCCGDGLHEVCCSAFDATNSRAQGDRRGRAKMHARRAQDSLLGYTFAVLDGKSKLRL